MLGHFPEWRKLVFCFPLEANVPKSKHQRSLWTNDVRSSLEQAMMAVRHSMEFSTGHVNGSHGRLEHTSVSLNAWLCLVWPLITSPGVF